MRQTDIKQRTTARLSDEADRRLHKSNVKIYLCTDPKVELLGSRGIPVMVMEPLRGGKLADLGTESNGRLKALRTDKCIGCGGCASVCPQYIDIPGVYYHFLLDKTFETI